MELRMNIFLKNVRKPLGNREYDFNFGNNMKYHTLQ